jgi:hypothetical protein
MTCFIFNTGIEDRLKTMPSHKFKINNSITMFQIIIKIILFLEQNFSYLKQRSNLSVGFFVQFKELAIGNFIVYQKIFNLVGFPLIKR